MPVLPESPSTAGGSARVRSGSSAEAAASEGLINPGLQRSKSELSPLSSAFDHLAEPTDDDRTMDAAAAGQTRRRRVAATRASKLVTSTVSAGRSQAINIERTWCGSWVCPRSRVSMVMMTVMMTVMMMVMMMIVSVSTTLLGLAVGVSVC